MFHLDFFRQLFIWDIVYNSEIAYELISSTCLSFSRSFYLLTNLRSVAPAVQLKAMINQLLLPKVEKLKIFVIANDTKYNPHCVVALCPQFFAWNNNTIKCRKRK